MRKITSHFTAVILIFFFISSCSKETVAIDIEDVNIILDVIGKDLNANIKVDPSVTRENSIIINSEEDYRNFIINVRKEFEKNYNIILENKLSGVNSRGCANGVYSGTAVSTITSDLVFDVSVSGGCISGISGSLTGFTLGVSYTQGATTFGCSSGTVCGTINYNLFFEGVGTIYSDRVCYSITLNC